MSGALDDHGTRFMAVELEGREEIHVFDGLDMPAGKHAQSGFGEGFDSHDTGQHRRAVNLMIVKEGLNLRIERSLNRSKE